MLVSINEYSALINVMKLIIPLHAPIINDHFKTKRRSVYTFWPSYHLFKLITSVLDMSCVIKETRAVFHWIDMKKDGAFDATYTIRKNHH